jgi:hypothetical protein
MLKKQTAEHDSFVYRTPLALQAPLARYQHMAGLGRADDGTCSEDRPCKLG